VQQGGSPVFDFSLVVQPNHLPALLRQTQAFQMVLTLQARAIEADSDRYRFKISWNGQWSDDTLVMANHLVVAQL
jgi:hypothetical protein